MDDRDGIILDDDGDGQILDNELTYPQHHQHQLRSLSDFGSTCEYSEPHTCTPLPLVIRFIPRIFRFDNAPPETTGLALDMYARGTILMSSLFMGPALLSMARNAAQELCNDCGDNARVYGMKPSSLLSNIAIGSGLLGAFILPLFGAIVDHTPHRRGVGIWSAVGLAAIKGVETIISARTWLFVAVLQTISGALFFVHATATYAYTSELTDNHMEQTKYNVYYFVVLYISALVFLTEVLIIAFAMHADDVGTARISQVITCLTSSICFAISWKWLFRERPALSAVPEGSTLLVTGFEKIAASFTMIRNKCPGLKWFMWAVISSESATAALITIATTYMNHFLEMGTTEIGVVFVLVLAMGIPGSKMGELLGLRHNPLTSAKICVIFFIVSTTAAALILTGPQDKHLTPVFGALWGLGLGWLHPMNSTIFITISPRGQASELMAIYLFCGQVFSWLPPLLFTILNEAGVPMSVGLASLNIFFMAGLIFLFLMGDYSASLARGATMVPGEEFVKDHCREISLSPIS